MDASVFVLVAVLCLCNIVFAVCRDIMTDKIQVHVYMLTRQVNYMAIAFFVAYSTGMAISDDMLLVISPAVFCMFGMFVLAFSVRGSGMELVSSSSLLSHVLVPFVCAYMLCFSCVRSGTGHVALSVLPFVLTFSGQVASVARGIYVYGTLDVTRHKKMCLAISVACLGVFWGARMGVEALNTDPVTGEVVPVSDLARLAISTGIVGVVVFAIVARSYNEGKIWMGATMYDTPD